MSKTSVQIWLVKMPQLFMESHGSAGAWGLKMTVSVHGRAAGRSASTSQLFWAGH